MLCPVCSKKTCVVCERRPVEHDQSMLHNLCRECTLESLKEIFRGKDE